MIDLNVIILLAYNVVRHDLDLVMLHFNGGSFVVFYEFESSEESMKWKAMSDYKCCESVPFKSRDLGTACIRLDVFHINVSAELASRDIGHMIGHVVVIRRDIL